MQKYYFALDLIDDPEIIAAYEHWHKSENLRPEIMQNIRDAGVTNMEIFRTGNRLFMIMETDDSFTFERKAALDANNSKVQEWEKFVWEFQKPLPWARKGEKWILMNQIFKLP
jgi:L-rhamnose mutarotase